MSRPADGECVRLVHQAPDGDPVHVLAILEGNTLYIVLAHAKTGSNTLYRALVKSFVPTAAG